MTRPRIRFDRNELSGAFGDLGTDFPLVVGMIAAAGLDAGSVFTLFGMMQLLSGLVYGLPMPVQPLKAMAVIVITQKLAPGVLYGGGLAIGVVMLALTVSGLLERLAAWVPTTVVRGVQLGLGLQLATLALRDYVPSQGRAGYAVAGAAFVIIVLLLGNRRLPPATLVVCLGALYALALGTASLLSPLRLGFNLPRVHVPAWSDVLTGALVLALPQLPLSLANSVLGSCQAIRDFFPSRPVSIRKIGLTYSLMNLVNPFLGGVPTCHGTGGIAGHYAFGGRTGGSVVIEGALYMAVGLFAVGGLDAIVSLFPRPVLGVILLFEAITLMRLARDTAAVPAHFSVALLVAVIAASLPYGYVIGLVIGTAVLRWLPGPRLSRLGQ